MKKLLPAFGLLLLVLPGHSDPLLPRTPNQDSAYAVITYAPHDHQLLSRLPSTMEGDIVYQGKLSGFGKGQLRIMATSNGIPNVIQIQSAPESISAKRQFSISATLTAGLHAYDVELAYKENTAGSWTALTGTMDVVVGDAFLISGQSNGVFKGECPSDVREELDPGITATVCPNGADGFAITPTPAMTPSPYVRSFGAIPWIECSSQVHLIERGRKDREWHLAQDQDFNSPGYVGAWPLAFAYQVMDAKSIPVAILNGCQGGTSIMKNQRSSIPTDPMTIYGQLLNRYRASGLNSIKGIFWHQGEHHRLSGNTDPCLTSPVPTMLQSTYEAEFDNLLSAWLSDYSVENVFVLQVRTEHDYLTSSGANDMAGVFEAQRTMYQGRPKVVTQTTAGIPLPPNDTGGFNIHFDRLGYEEVALNAYSAAGATYSDYPASTAKPYSPVEPLSATLAPAGAGTYFDIEFDVGLTNPLDTLVDDAATRARFLVPSATVVQVQSLSYNTVRIHYQSSSSPTEVTYRLFGPDGPWIRSQNDNYAFGFTIPVN